jgi:NAD(P)-dependent dehydrogenase (short-subunit alcohol dehydrogenase family)
MRAADTVTLVTGGGNGIGAEVARAFAARGDSVVVADIRMEDATRTARAIESNGGIGVPVQVDVTDQDSVRTMVDIALAGSGRLDVVANIAGAWLRPRSVGFQEYTKVSADDWDWVMDVNLKGTFNVCQTVGPILSRQGNGKIVNMASATFFGGIAGLVHYVASKGGVIGLTRVLARELGEYGVQVNAVAPGAIMTEDDPSPETRAVYAEKAKVRSIKRIGYAADVVGPILFFASEAADFVTGQTLVVDGGVFMH